jgi:hypothetical protein
MLWPYRDILDIAYLDDRVVCYDTLEEHKNHGRTVLEVLLKAGLSLKLHRCKFNAKEIRFIGFIISPEEVHMEKNCIATI